MILPTTPPLEISSGGVVLLGACVYAVHMMTTTDIQYDDVIPVDVALVIVDGNLAIYPIQDIPQGASVESTYHVDDLDIWGNVMEDVAAAVGDPDRDVDVVDLFDRHLEGSIYL